MLSIRGVILEFGAYINCDHQNNKNMLGFDLVHTNPTITKKISLPIRLAS